MGGKPTEFRSAQFPKNALAVPCREQARSAANTAAVADAKLANTRAARLTPLAPEMVSPGRKPLPAGAVVVQSNSAKGPVSRILSCAVIPLGAALPRTLISDLPGGFGDCIEQPEKAPRHAKSRLGASGRCAAPFWLLKGCFPPYLVLLRVGFTLPPALQSGRCALTAPFHPYPGAGMIATTGRTGLGIAVPGWPSTGSVKRARKRGSRGGIFSVALAVCRP